MQWDKGPPAAIAQLFEQAPLDEYRLKPKKFRLEWGPIYYRGRTNGSAKILVVGQDPAADENVARRILVGTAGQRVQGYLTKLGITRSYVMVNAVLYSIHGQFDQHMRTFMDLPTVSRWHHNLMDAMAGPKIEAILAFGAAARHVVRAWPGGAAFESQGRVFHLTHPTARPESDVLADWNAKLAKIAAVVTPDPGGTVNLTKYVGPKFEPSDLVRVPLYDFGFGAPLWFGDGDSAVRVSPNKPLPSLVQGKTAIAWVPTGSDG